MQKSHYILVAVFAAAVLFTIAAPFKSYKKSITSDKTFVIGIYPRRHVSITEEMFEPLAKYLELQLKQKVKIETAPIHDQFWMGVKQKKYDLVHLNQYQYVMSKAQFGYEAIAMNEENGKSTSTATLVVRKDSGINSIGDLLNKKIIFGGGPKSMQSYIYARYLLEKAGLQKNDYEVEWAPNPPSAIISAFYQLNQVAAAGTVDNAIQSAGKQIDSSKLKVLARGDQLAQTPWAVKGSLDPKHKQKIQSVLLDMANTEKGKQALLHAGLTGIVMAKDKDFDAHRKIVKAVLGEVYQ